MTTSRFRRALRLQPRWMLAVLLAFAIETLPPPSVFVAHRHADGGVAHTHVGPIAGTSGSAAASGWAGTMRVTGRGIAHAPASDLHRHTVHPVVAVRGPAAAPPGPHLLVSDVPAPTAPAAPAVCARSGQARAPPVLDA